MIYCDVSKTICNNCLLRCDFCKKIFKSTGDLILREEIIGNKLDDKFLSQHVKLCKTCMIDIHHGTSEPKIEYSLETSLTYKGFLLFQGWKLDREKKTCRYCKDTYLKYEDLRQWQREQERDKHQEELNDCCEKCYKKTRKELKEKLKVNDPSNDNMFYEFDESKLKWILHKIKQTCKFCQNPYYDYLDIDKFYVTVRQRLQKRDKIRVNTDLNYCCDSCFISNYKNHNPSDYCHKYKWSENTYELWVLSKVKVYENNRHKWINPKYNYDKNYYCRCKVCVKENYEFLNSIDRL